MGIYADLISPLPLYQELDRAAGRDAIPATDVAILKGLVNDVADEVGPVLARIPLIFRQYTVHDISHSRNVIERMGDILPKTTRDNLNALEITFLLLAALLHDVGMEVTDQEKAETLASESFRSGHAEQNKVIEDARAAGNDLRAQAIQEAMLADHYRRLHAQRARLFMDRHLNGRLRFREVDFTEDLARLCESHAWGVEESNDASHPQHAVFRLDDNVRLYGVRVNLQYLACILRLGDILDFDRSRTPLAVFQHLDFSELKSWEEWNKHLQVKGWEITPTQVAFEIPCTHPVFYVAVHEFLGWIDDELQQCRYLVENKPQATADRYQLHLPQVVDRHKVRMADPSYVAGAFRFQLEYENILTLLMDKSLYPDPSLFLRELLQNALDACRRKEADMEVKGLKQIYTPKIVVWDHTDDPDHPRVVFQDNGIGMSQRIVEHYFLRVGRSYYRSPEFDAERQRLWEEHKKELDACSQFGIGILSCFLVGDRFEVETFQEGYDPLRILIEGPTKYFVMRKLSRPDLGLLYQKASSDEKDGPPNRTGTRITVHLRPGVKIDVWQTLDTFAVNVDYPVAVYRIGRKKPRTIAALRWEKPLRVEDCYFGDSADKKGSKFPALKGALIASIIPFPRHLRGRSWFWLLRGRNDQPTPRAGFLEVGSELRLTGIPKIVALLDGEQRRLEKMTPYYEWSDRLRKRTAALPGRDPLVESWLELSDEEKNRLDEVISRRSQVLARGDRLQDWIQWPEVVKALLRGTIEWADLPVEFPAGFFTSVKAGVDKVHPVISSFFEVDTLTRSSQEECVAVNSILLPDGIVKWSNEKAHSQRVKLSPLLGRVRVDFRGPHAPQPAVNRLSARVGEELDLFQQYLHIVLMHGLGLVAQHGKTQDWRKWFCELAGSAISSLNRTVFAELYGQMVEDVCGLAVRVNGEISYLSRAEILALTPGSNHFVLDENSSQGLLWRDPVNRLLSVLPDDYRIDEGSELNLSSLPIVKAKN